MPEKTFFQLSCLFMLFLFPALFQGGFLYAQTVGTTPRPAARESMRVLPFSPLPADNAPTAVLRLDARMVKQGPVIKNGLAWHIFSPAAREGEKLPLIAHSEGGPAEFNLAPGDYIVHAAFGKAGVTRHVRLEAGKTVSENIVLNAGALKLNAVLPDGIINESQLKFSIYAETGENNEQFLIISNVMAGTVVRLDAGLYHVVSSYGTANASVRSDILVEAGKLTEATVQHRAAQITLKLVRQEGGEALADTSWAIMNDSGDIIREIVNAYAALILAEGDYVAVAKNKGQIYQKEFSVISGKDEEIGVLAIPQNSADDAAMD